MERGKLIEAGWSTGIYRVNQHQARGPDSILSGKNLCGLDRDLPAPEEDTSSSLLVDTL
jgi:hypothetical protein